MTTSVAFAESEAELARLLPAWEALWQADPDADIFSHPIWFDIWWKHFATGAIGGGIPLHWGDQVLELPVRKRKLRITTTYRDGVLESVWPLTFVSTRWRRCSMGALALPTNRHAPRSGMVVGGGDPMVRMDAIIKSLHALHAHRDWQLFVHDGLAQHLPLDIDEAFIAQKDAASPVRHGDTASCIWMATGRGFYARKASIFASA